MSRLAISDAVRRMRAEDARTPVEAAFYSVLALSKADAEIFASRWAKHHEGRPTKAFLNINVNEAAE